MSLTTAAPLLLLLLVCTTVSSFQPSCRFAPKFTQDQLLSNSSARLEFLRLVAYWEGKFHTPYISYNPKNGITYDGRAINYTTGEPSEPLHEFSAASKESVHVAMLALAVAGNQLAQIFCSPDDPTQGRDNAIELLDLKMQTYETFNITYPGFGGFLPWISVNDSGISPLAPAWSDRVPSLDNGEWAWSLLAASWALDSAKEKSLAKRYRAYFDYLASTALIVFYEGGGKLRTVTGIKDPTAPVSENVYYNLNCTSDTCYLDDPYEGELFAFLADLYSDWAALNYSSSERDLIWVFKRGKLQSIELSTSSGPITVQRGWWFSSHEQWKYLELPYLDSQINARVFVNSERARTTFSAMNRYPGLFASVNDVTDGGENIPDYANAAGVQPIAFEQVLRNDIVTPYGSFPVFLANYTIGMAWYANMLKGPRMQGLFGSTEAVAINGTMISPLVTWDSKITTMTAISGGISWINKKALLADQKYDRFISVVDKEWSLAFPTLKGEDLDFQLPPTSIPAALSDWPTCSS